MFKRTIYPLIPLCIVLCCAAQNSAQIKNLKKGGTMSIELISSEFKEGETIPAKYTCDGKDVSPPLNWSGAPEGTKSFALICDDPDAPVGTWVHWVIYNIPDSVVLLPEAISMKKSVMEDVLQGMTDFRRIGYGGPCPPRGSHRYYFKIYALDIILNLPAGATKVKLLKAMEGHILAEGQLMGKYSR